MATQPATFNLPQPALRPALVYGIAACFLAAGVAAGYLSRGSFQSIPPVQSATARPANSAAAMAHGHAPTLEDLKRMADKKAAPLIEQLKSNSNNTDLLVQIGAIYHGTHQFKEASVYYGRAVQVDPKNAGLRSKYASSLYRQGDVDGALAQLNEALTYAPNDPNALFNLGMIRLQGKNDAKGALAAWRKLLKTHPELGPNQRAEVQRLMTNAGTASAEASGMQGEQPHVQP